MSYDTLNCTYRLVPLIPPFLPSCKNPFIMLHFHAGIAFTVGKFNKFYDILIILEKRVLWFEYFEKIDGAKSWKYSKFSVKTLVRWRSKYSKIAFLLFYIEVQKCAWFYFVESVDIFPSLLSKSNACII